MKDGICFADVDLPFHVWVRERSGDRYRWVLREAPRRGGREDGDPLTDPEPSTGASEAPL